MLARVLADIVVGIHFLFVVFVVCGSGLALRWPKVAWIHVPAFLWGGGIAILGWVCPLTYLENDLRRQGAQAGYDTSFIEAYILPLLYPDLLFDGGLPRSGFIALGLFVLALNGLIYWRILKRP